MNSLLILSFISSTMYYVICAVLTVLVLVGIFLMSKVKLAAIGNRLSALVISLAIIITIIYKDLLPNWIIYPSIAVGLVIGLVLAYRVKMIQMPEMVALLNGLGGLASALIGAFAIFGIGIDKALLGPFATITSYVALIVGAVTFVGSLIAALKLHKLISQKPYKVPFYSFITSCSLVIFLAAIIVAVIPGALSSRVIFPICVVVAMLFGLVFTLRVGGADMPITISLLNSFSGVAGSIAGLAIGDVLLVSVGAIVGASGLLLTRVMCKAMNRSLLDILLGKTTKVTTNTKEEPVTENQDSETEVQGENEEIEIDDPIALLKNAKNVIIVPGYGMAIAQAQHLVKMLQDVLKTNNTTVKYAVHPVAGRMPGHMNVLLCEADVDYADLYEMDDINSEFKNADVTIVIGANDVINPSARDQEGTPIYKMPILNVDECAHIIIFNYDLKPGYAGVDNPLYSRKNGVTKILGNAAKTLEDFIVELKK